MENIYKQLFKDKLINEKQHELLDAIQSNKIISLYYELRLTLYLGILLFTSGLGYFAYQNLGNIGHILSMLLIAIAIVVGFFFIKKYALPYSSEKVTVTKPFFDYLLLLVSLLMIALLTYIQVYFDLVELLLYWTSYLSTAILLFMAYRYDNKALLAMGITAFAASVGLSISPVNWIRGEWVPTSSLYLISIFLGIVLIAVGQYTHQQHIKAHFKFTYQNFGILLYYIGCLSGMADGDFQHLFTFILLVSAGALSYYTWQTKEFLFFLYSNLCCFIAFTYLIFSLLFEIGNGSEILLVYYFPVTCITYIVLLITKKSHFTND
ncbi:MAG: DUF2157 domain-containing protein [Flavobacteriales bacterium]|nr:DUF2157 domain-containing protein [Flavobacteriales bacterium]MCB9363507.1 DUF2157 domain-containing protein [Flavobacteriales bacterium]